MQQQSPGHNLCHHGTSCDRSVDRLAAQTLLAVLISGKTPCRSNASVALHGNKLFMFGGCDEGGAATRSLYSLDLATLAHGGSWVSCVQAGDVPSPR